MRFADRRTAGELLGKTVAALGPSRPMVAALPRGGVPVGFEVARVLGCELDVLVVRKVGVPFHPELAMGAVAEGDVVIENREVIDAIGIDEQEFTAAVALEMKTLALRLDEYRETVPGVDPTGKTVIVVDDGLATGSTALAAIQGLRRRGASQVWLAVPVAPPEVIPMLEKAADRVIVLASPRRFTAVGIWYRDFSQTSDDEVRDLLRRSRTSS